MWYGQLPQHLLVSFLAATTVTAASSSSSLTPANRIIHTKTCPQSCTKVGKDYEKWSHFHTLDDLSVCPEPLLLAFNLYTPLDSASSPISIRACTLGDASTEDNFLVEAEYVDADAKGETNFGGSAKFRRRSEENGSADGTTCGDDEPRMAKSAVKVLRWDDASSSPASSGLRSLAADVNDDVETDVVRAVKALATQIKKDESCDQLIQFAYLRGTLVGVYSGALIDKSKTAAELTTTLATELGKSAARTALELCGKDRSSASTFGVIADASGDFAAVQKIMKSWNEAECVSTADETKSTMTDIWSYDLSIPLVLGDSTGLQKRAECRSIKIESGDDCTKLPARCGLGSAAFKSFNKGLCDNILQPGQPVCCSSGDLPDIKPKPQADGTCATYAVESGEGCQAVAVKHGLTQKDLEDMNKKTWAWDGCGPFLLGQRICVSSGEPPMPQSYPDALCGPTKPGSKRPTDGTSLVDMNPCPLNVCCNVWGNCGIDKDFCTISKTKTNNPGTSQPGENGCQSSCGTKIVNNGKGPDVYRKIAYYEGWNYNRPCLNMNVLEIKKEDYTHVHFAFAEITADMQVVIPEDSKTQFEHFVNAKDYPNKVLAFGGWAFSNEGPGAGRLREAVSPANRHTFSDRVVKFLVDNKLDGLDFDWEYPGATDIDGSPPGTPEDGDAYLAFLRLVRVKLPKGKSLSIAAPASYWYLRNFPIDKIVFELDYAVFMTYDFHGQWDVGNDWAMSGCKAGNCLRSHVNSTITQDSFVMITKAGVPTHKMVVGVSSYGRSFKMSDSSCRGPQCTFLGGRNQSPAKPGRCTGVGGYISNFEINEIIKKGGAIKSWYDQPTDTDYLVYNQVEWVGYMSDITKDRRAGEYKGLNMGGTSDWAVDLQGEGSMDEDDEGDSDYVPDPDYDKPLKPCTYSPTTMDNITNLDFRNEIEPHCASKYLIAVLHAMLKKIKERFGEILKDGYDGYFDIYAQNVYVNAGDAMWNLMQTKGDQYFDCEAYSKYACCAGCQATLGVNCKNCINDCKITSSRHDGWEWRRKKMACPPDMSGRGWDSARYYMESVYWSFKSDDHKKKFLEEVEINIGAEEKYLSFPANSPHYKSRLAIEMCYGSRPRPDGSIPGYDELGEGCQAEHWWHNGPSIGNGFSAKSIFNPKTSIEKTMNDIDILPVLAEYELALLADEYDEDDNDLIDALILPIFMMEGGLDFMEEVVKMAKEIKESEKVTLITNLLSAVLLLVGGAGGVLAASANTALRLMGRSLVALAEAGNTAMGIHATVSNPEGWPILLFGLVMSGTSLRSAANVKKAAGISKGLDTLEIAKTNPYAARMAGIVRSNNVRGSTNWCRWG